MSYSQRVTFATVLSVLAHLVVLWIGLTRVDATPKRETMAEVPPIMFKFEQPPEPEPEPERQRIRRLIDTPTPTDEPVEETDLISDSNSKAADQSEKSGENLAPVSENVDDFEQVELKPTPQQELSPPQPVTPPVPASPQEPTPEVSEAQETTKEALELPEMTVPTRTTLLNEVESGPVKAREEREAEEQQPEKETAPAPERFQVAQASPPPSPKQVVQDVREGKTRDDSGTDRNGVLSFEANQHEMGEYMLHVRNKVEKSWRGAIRSKHSGVRHAEARIRLVIRPDGQIELVEILDDGGALVFAVLSREAVKDAGPFDPFPFDVPEIYRSENLDVTWRFTFN